MSDSYLDQCPHCTVLFVNPAAIEQHIREQHGVVPHVPGQPDPLACPHCGALAKNAAGLKSHIRSKHGSSTENTPAA